MGNTTGVSDTNFVQKVNPNARYRSYTESNRATIKSSMDSLEECLGETQITEVPVRDLRTVFPGAKEFYCLTAVTGAVHILDRL